MLPENTSFEGKSQRFVICLYGLLSQIGGFGRNLTYFKVLILILAYIFELDMTIDISGGTSIGEHVWTLSV